MRECGECCKCPAPTSNFNCLKLFYRYFQKIRTSKIAEEGRVGKLAVEHDRFNMPMDWLKTNVSEELFKQLLDLKEKCQRIIIETSGKEEEEEKALAKMDESEAIKKLILCILFFRRSVLCRGSAGGEESPLAFQ